MWQTLFWISVGIVFYTYVGYGVLVAFFNLFRKEELPPDPPEEMPHVTMVVAAYNEADIIEQKILNTFKLDHPADKLQLIVVADGSTDDTVAIVKRYPQVSLLFIPERQGKTAALNRAIPFVASPIVVFSDANSMLNKEALRSMIRHFEDPQVGGVAGEKKILDAGSSVGRGEGVYWRYESMMKQLDATFHTGIGAAGELFAMRTALYQPLPDNILLDDLVQSISLPLRGHRLAYEPNAYAMEGPSFSFADEWKRKVRIAAGAWQTMFSHPSLFAFWERPLISFQFISRRVFRWVFCPLALILTIISNYFLWQESGGLYAVTWWMQVGFYALALIGWSWHSSGRSGWWWLLPFYFSFANLAQIVGAFSWISGSQQVLWQKVKRKEM